MKRWPTKPLGELSESVMGQAPPGNASNFDGKGSPFVKAGEFGERRPIIREWTTKPLKFAKSSDVLVCVVGATCGKLNLGADCAIGRSVAAIRPNPSLLNQGFLYAFLQGWTLRLRSGSQGSAQGVITRDMLGSIPVPVPPLAEQERIVKLLDEADELRKLRAESDRRTAVLIPALFHEMFGDPEANLKGWPRGQLKDFGAEIRYGLGQPPEEHPEGVPILRATNVKRGYISEIGLIRVRREAVPVSRNAFLNADDVLVVRSGAYTGDIARVGEKWAGSVAGYDLVVSPKERLTGDFIAWFLLSDFVQDRYFNGLKLRAAQPHLNSTQLSETPFFCPPLPLQKEFAKRVTEIRELEVEQAASRRRLDDLFQSTLHRAFQGEL